MLPPPPSVCTYTVSFAEASSPAVTLPLSQLLACDSILQ